MCTRAIKSLFSLTRSRPIRRPMQIRTFWESRCIRLRKPEAGRPHLLRPFRKPNPVAECGQAGRTGMAGALQLWETLKEAITAYTGLSPAAFFTTLAVAVAFYHVVSGFFRAPAPVQRGINEPEEEMEPLPPPVQLGEITEEELKAYDGSDPKKPLLMAIKGQIYDVSQSRMFYGPGGPYALFAGRDASRALAKMSFDAKDLTRDISGLGPFELEALQDWEYKFMSKYVKVGAVKSTFPVADERTSSATEEIEGAAKPVEASPANSSDEHVPKPPEANLSAGNAEEAKEADGLHD